jgi:hypothetical protein
VSGATLAVLEDQLAGDEPEGSEILYVQTHARAAVAGTPGPPPPLDAALVLLASVVPLTTLFTKREWKARRERVETLAQLAADAIPSFREVLKQMRHTRRSAYSAGGPVH